MSISEGQTTQILKSDLTKGVSVVAMMLSPQVEEGFGYATLGSDTKISKLILCFSIFLFYISCWVKKNLASLAERRQYIELMYKCPDNNDQFTTYVNELWKIVMNAFTSQIELS